MRRLTPVSLSVEEYAVTVRNAAAHGLTRGRICDALLLAWAGKCQTKVIYTWNLKHYQTIAPHLASHIKNP